MGLNSSPALRLSRASLITVLILLILAPPVAEAGRRGVRIDFGAWGVNLAINISNGVNPCPHDAGASGSPGEYLYGFVSLNPLFFQTASFYQPDTITQAYCQLSRAYAPGRLPDEYLNEAAFPEEERDLAYMIGPNTDNTVSAIRYSFLGQNSNGIYGRQWAFYFFPDNLMVVGLYGVPDDGSTYPFEGIFDYEDFVYDWESVRDGFDGQYFCFQGNDYIGDCVPPAPPPPPPPPPVEMIFRDNFE